MPYQLNDLVAAGGFAALAAAFFLLKRRRMALGLGGSLLFTSSAGKKDVASSLVELKENLARLEDDMRERESLLKKWK